MTRLNVHLYRDSFNTPWGFRLQGGKDLNQPLTVQRVFSNSPAEGELQRGDNILSINGRDTSVLTHKQAQDNIKHGGGQIQLVIYRPPPGTSVAPLSPPIVTPRPRAPSLQSPSHYSPRPRTSHYNQSPSFNNMNGDPYYGYRPENPSATYKSQPTYLQIQVNSPTQHQQYYLQQQKQQQQQQPARYRSSFSQPPVTPTTPPPPWTSQQSAPRRVSKLSQLGHGGQTFGTDFATLPRRASSAHHGATMHHRPRPDNFAPDEEREPELPLATGPVPKVCSRRNLGGGGLNFGTAYGRSATLPRRHDVGRRSSQPPSLPSAGYAYSPSKVSSPRYGGAQSFGTDYNSPRGLGQTPAQRVQTTLDNITLSPRTPEAPQSSALYQPYTPAQQPSYASPSQPQQLSPQYRPQQVYTPTSLLLEQQRLQGQPQQHQYHQPQQAEEGEEDIPPVWERRRMFQQIDNATKSPVRTPMSHPKPVVLKPQASNKYAPSYGQDYSNRGPQQSNAVWRPSQPSPGATRYSQPYSPGHQAPDLVHSAPPPWKRPDDEVDDATPAWRSTLKSASGVKPWERELDYQQERQGQQAPRSVPYNPAPAQAPAQAISPASTGGPRVVHLQYNSPMNLYSSQNVADTYASHTQALSSAGGIAPKPAPVNQAGDRDWSQSAVLQFLNQENKRGGPAVAPKPAVQKTTVHLTPAPAQQLQQNYYDDAVGASDF